MLISLEGEDCISPEAPCDTSGRWYTTVTGSTSIGVSLGHLV
jgi:hypothetical protein